MYVESVFIEPNNFYKLMTIQNPYFKNWEWRIQYIAHVPKIQLIFNFPPTIGLTIFTREFLKLLKTELESTFETVGRI